MRPEYLPQTPEGRRWHLAEECSEVIKALSKIARFGVIGVGHDGHSSNRAALLSELADLKYTIAAVEGDLEKYDAAA